MQKLDPPKSALSKFFSRNHIQGVDRAIHHLLDCWSEDMHCNTVGADVLGSRLIGA